MEYRYLGKSGLQVSSLSFGAWVTMGNQVTDQLAEDIMIKAYDEGINFFDNAEVYALGKAEIVMGNILKKTQWQRSSYVVSSKAFFGAGGKKPNQTGLSRKHLIEACHEALQRFQLNYLDLYFCHRPDPNTPIEETVWTMNLLIQQGKILYWGTSEWSAQQITEAHAVAQAHHLIPPLMEQPQYNMLTRKRFEKEYEPLFKNFGMGTTIWSPLMSGLLTGKYNNGIPADSRLGIEKNQWLSANILTPENIKKVQQLTQFATQQLGISMTHLAIAWCLKNPTVSTVITGATHLNQLTENLGALQTVAKLTPEVMQHIEVILDNNPA